MMHGLRRGKFSKYDVIPTLVEIAKSAVKEKIIRVVVATFKVSRKKAMCPWRHYKLICSPFAESCRKGTAGQSVGNAGGQAAAVRGASEHAQVVGPGGGGGH